MNIPGSKHQTTPKEVLESLYPMGTIEDERGVVGVWLGYELEWEAKSGESASWGMPRQLMHHIKIATRSKNGRPMATATSIAIGGGDGQDGRSRPETKADRCRRAVKSIFSSRSDTLFYNGGVSSFVSVLELAGIVGQTHEGVADPAEIENIVKKLDDICPAYAATNRATALAHFHEGTSAFAATLDPQAIAFAKACADRTRGTLHWMTDAIWCGIDATFTPGAPLLRHLMAAPNHADLLTRFWRKNTSAFDGDTVELLCKAIPGISSSPAPKPALMRAFVEKGGMIREAIEEGILRNMWTRRHAEGIPPYHSFDLETTKATTVATVMAKLPLDWIPNSVDEWQAAMLLSLPMAAAEHRLHTYGAAATLLNVKGRWRTFEERLVKASGGRELMPSVADIEDMVNAFDRQVATPCKARLLMSEGHASEIADACGSNEGGDKRVMRLLFEERSLPRILEDSRRWHGRQGEIDDKIASITPGAACETYWDPALPEWHCEEEGLTIVVLTTRASLAQEGERGANIDGTQGMSHCVGGYAEDCRFERSRIVSVRRDLPGGGFERLATAELKVPDTGNGKGGTQLGLIQHRGKGNSEPPMEAVRALSAYIKGCEEGRLNVRRDEAEPHEKTSTVSARCGYDWSSPGAVETAIAAWASCVPRRLRTMSPEEIGMAAGGIGQHRDTGIAEDDAPKL